MKVTSKATKARIRKIKRQFGRVKLQGYIQVAATVVLTLTAYFNIRGEDITSWGVLFSYLGKAIDNPYLLTLIALSVYNLFTHKPVQNTESKKG